MAATAMARPKYIETEEGRQKHEEKYQRILDAALEVFANKGFYEAKVTEIAKVAGVADGTIYLYFKNKDDLLISLFESKLEHINCKLREELAKVTGVRARLEHLVWFHLRIALDNPTTARFMTIELRRSAKFMKDYAKEQLAEYVDQWGQVLEEGKATGVLRPDLKTGIFKHLLFGALDHAIMLWVNNPHGKPEDLEEIAAEVTRYVLRSVTTEDEFVPTRR
jgi:TetR/AcrR family transcriptional regulator, fatty acid metabolism regulator protein